MYKIDLITKFKSVVNNNNNKREKQETIVKYNENVLYVIPGKSIYSAVASQQHCSIRQAPPDAGHKIFNFLLFSFFLFIFFFTIVDYYWLKCDIKIYCGMYSFVADKSNIIKCQLQKM